MERPDAIELVRKLRRLGQGDGPEAAVARTQAAKHMAKHGLTEAELEEVEAEQAQAESSGGGPRFASRKGDPIGEGYLEDFVKRVRATLCHEGRRRGRFADHPHADKILRARARAKEAP